MVDRLGIAADQQHLDVASGTGEPGLTVARRASGGRVMLTDLSEDMLAVASRRAAAEGLTNVETRVCSADDLPFDDGTFDSVSVRFGFMFFPDLPAATAEVVRVLRPGGRLAASVWIDPAANPWTSIVMQSVGAEVELPAPDPDGPSMYRCAAPGSVRSLFEGAGLVDVADWDVDLDLVTQSAEEYWDMASEHMSLAAAALRQVDEPTRDRIRARAIDEVTAYERDGRLHVPGRARCTIGTKP
jgi:SAM-dependent methyltransferase